MNSALLAALLAIPVVATAGAAAAQEQHISREGIEWCDIWIPDANSDKLPRVLLIGDSITRGYYDRVANGLQGKASVARLATSKSIGDPALLAEVAGVLDQCRFDVVHFNNGLHGWGYTEEEYRAHFPDLVATIRKHAPKAKLVWAMTTPMRQRDKLEELAPATERVKARNAIAKELAGKAGIPTEDLYSLVVDHPEYWGGDGVHFKPEGYAVLAGQVVKSIEGLLK